MCGRRGWAGSWPPHCPGLAGIDRPHVRIRPPLAPAIILVSTVTANMELSTQSYALQQREGVKLLIRAKHVENPLLLDDVAQIQAALSATPELRAVVLSASWVSFSLEKALSPKSIFGAADTNRMNSNVPPASMVELFNLGRAFSSTSLVYAVSPSVFKTMLPGYLLVDPDSSDPVERSTLDIAEQLYTARGSQRVLISTASSQTVSSTTLAGVTFNQSLLVQVSRDTLPLALTDRHVLKAGALLDAAPGFRFSKYPTALGRGAGTGADALVSMPTFVRLSRGAFPSVSAVPLQRLLLQLREPFTDAEKDMVKEACSAALQRIGRWSEGDMEIFDLATQIEDLSVTMTSLNFIFVGLTVVGLGLCFFSLLASTMANVAEQTKDIAVLRAIGLSGPKVVRVFVYEAFALVMSASLLGILVGTSVAWTFNLQRTLFTQLPVPLFVPWGTIAAVAITSVLAAVCSAAFPTHMLTRETVGTLLRRF